MKAAGVALVDRQIIVALIMDSAVQIRHMIKLADALDILSTAKPEVVGAYGMTDKMYTELAYAVNMVRIDSISDQDLKDATDAFVKLSLIKADDRYAIACGYLAMKKIA